MLLTDVELYVMSCRETIFNSCDVWQHTFFHLRLMTAQFRTCVMINRFSIFSFRHILQHYFVDHNFCDLCQIKIFSCVQEITCILKKRWWYCWQGIWLVYIKNNSWSMCMWGKNKMLKWNKRNNTWYRWVSSMLTIWLIFQIVLLFWLFCNLFTQTLVPKVGVTFWSWGIETQELIQVNFPMVNQFPCG